MCLPSVLWVSWGSPPALLVPSSRAAVFSGSTAEGLVALCCSSPLHFQSLLCLSRAKFHLGGRPWEAEGFVSSRILRSSPSCLPQASGRCPCWVSVRSPFGHHQCGFCAPPQPRDCALHSPFVTGVGGRLKDAPFKRLQVQVHLIQAFISHQPVNPSVSSEPLLRAASWAGLSCKGGGPCLQEPLRLVGSRHVLRGLSNARQIIT